MRIWRLTGLSLLLLLAAAAAQARPVLMISVDGLRPGDVLDADKRGIRVPVLKGLAAQGVYATGVRNVLPTVTYPDHTTLITGVWPQRHGIAGNQTFDPLRQNMAGWYWYARDIKVRTLWDAVHDSGGKVASLSWPVSVGAASIDFNIPEYWRADTPEDAELLEALSTPGLTVMLQKQTGISLADSSAGNVAGDDSRDRYAEALIAARHPAFTTIHLRALDEVEHMTGPGSPQAKLALQQLDASIGRLVAAARKAQPDLVVAIVSDHGFVPATRSVNLIPAFVKAGLVTLDAKGKPVRWKAEPWGSASAAIVLADPKNQAVKGQVAALLTRLAADPRYGIGHVADAAEIARLGGTPMASFWIDFKLGYALNSDVTAPEVSPGTQHGVHGYFPTHPEMRAAFILAGPGVPAKGSLGDIDMRSIAPTLAKIMNVPLPDADGKPLL